MNAVELIRRLAKPKEISEKTGIPMRRVRSHYYSESWPGKSDYEKYSDFCRKVVPFDENRDT